MRMFLLLLLLSYNSLSMSQTVSIRSDDWYPMNGDPNAALPGYMIELANKAFSEVDYQQTT